MAHVVLEGLLDINEPFGQQRHIDVAVAVNERFRSPAVGTKRSASSTGTTPTSATNRNDAAVVAGADPSVATTMWAFTSAARSTRTWMKRSMAALRTGSSRSAMTLS